MKKGISLIVLVITIIVMIILAASVVITLSNTGVINRASEAVDATNQSQVQDLAALIWADAYMGGKRGTELVNEVTTKLGEQGVTATDWNITVTDTGVTVTNKLANNGLGSLITTADYGKTVDYSVTVDGTTYSDWQIYYHNSDYVFLIAKNSVINTNLPTNMKASELTNLQLELYKTFKLGQEGFALTDTYINHCGIAWLITNFSNYANMVDYGSNVVGAIGGPTIELLAAGWNAMGRTPTINLTKDEKGYYLNGEYEVAGTDSDIYQPADHYYFLASPSACDYDENGCLMHTGYGSVTYAYNNADEIRPVVCLKASIPATVGTTTDFSLVK